MRAVLVLEPREALVTLNRQSLQEVVTELQCVLGGRIQRVDVVYEAEWVLSIRFPGRTLYLLVCARPGLGRVHLVQKRPKRHVDGGLLQKRLRELFEGQPLVALGVQGQTLTMAIPRGTAFIQLTGGKRLLRFVSEPVEVGFLAEGVGAHSLPRAFSVSERIAARYQQQRSGLLHEEARAQWRRRLLAKKRKRDRLLQNLKQDRARLQKMDDEARYGEALKAVLGQVVRGQNVAEATDWATGQAISIPLDPSLSPKKNMVRFFERSKKAKRGLPRVEARCARVQEEVDQIAQLMGSLESVEAADFLALEPTLQRAVGPLAMDGLPRAGRAQLPMHKRSPLDRWSRRFVAADGSEIRVGRGARENDRLTSAARGHDIWLHVRGVQGAHVILRMEKGASPDPGALLDAAHLAIFYSSQKGESHAEVLYAQARYVRKTKGAPPGQVGVSRSRTMSVTVDGRRYERLLGTHPKV